MREILDNGTFKVVSEYIFDNLIKAIDVDRMDEAVKKKSRSMRADLVMNILRTATKDSDMLMIDGTPHVFNGKVYERFTWHDLGNAIYDVMRSCGVPDGDYFKTDAIIKVCSRMVQSRQVSINGNLFGMANGIYDASDGVLKPFSPKHIVNAIVDYDYQRSMKCPNWKKFLSRVLPDSAHQELLQEFLAACFIDRGEVKIEHALILHGSGANGKSVVFETVMSLFGDGNVSTFAINDLIGGKRETYIASINGKKINYCSEIRTPEIGKFNADAFKSLVSGETTMARGLYKDPFKAKNIPLIMANANRLPRITDVSNSLIRRLLIIPFFEVIQPEEQDKMLPSKLRTELAGIFNWVAEGIVRLKRNGYHLDIPDSVKNYVLSYVAEEDSVACFLRDNLIACRFSKEINPVSQFIISSNLYNEFTAWASKKGASTVTKREFTKQMEQLGYVKARHSEGVGFYIYRGLSREELLRRNMMIAIEMFNDSSIKTKDQLDGKIGLLRVKSISEVEEHLCLPHDSLWAVLMDGKLDGSFVYTANGAEYDVLQVQKKLAECSFYSELKENRRAFMQNALEKKKRSSRRFNEMMRARGFVFRKYENEQRIPNPIDPVGCIYVPYEWRYTEENADEMYKRAGVIH